MHPRMTMIAPAAECRAKILRYLTRQRPWILDEQGGVLLARPCEARSARPLPEGTVIRRITRREAQSIAARLDGVVLLIDPAPYPPIPECN